MKIKSVLVFLVILLSAHQTAFSAPKEWKVFVLPPAIETKQEVKSAPAGWIVITETVSNRLAGITVFDGRPEQKASLVPDREDRQKDNRLIVSWRLSPSSAEGIWLALSYSSTSAVLACKLPQGATGLRVIYDTSITIGGMYEIVRVEYS
jgi:hypothetical protein